MEAKFMVAQFDTSVAEGDCQDYADGVQELYRLFNFDFVAFGVAPFAGAPLRWVYSAGETSNRFRRIALSPGHGIGGIVLRAGKPMLFTDIDTELDPREYSSYPIVFAEDLRSFCALPVKKGDRVGGVLLLAFRTASDDHIASFRGCLAHLDGKFCGLPIVAEDFMDFEMISRQEDAPVDLMNRTMMSTAIMAQEEERKRISREIHDGIVQELLSVTLLLNNLDCVLDDDSQRGMLGEAVANIDRILDELHDLSVQLRPSILDHFGLKAALRSQAMVCEQTFGARVEIGGADIPRFDRAYETQIYRICQEALVNACKYSGSDVVRITFQHDQEWLQATVEDDGIGFDVEKPAVKGSGCGLSGMRERANMIGATLEITSGVQGTRVSLVAPMYDVVFEEGM